MAREELQKVLKEHKKRIDTARDEIGKTVIGQRETVDSVLRAIIADGHVLLEGVPGLAKTLLVNTMSVVSGCVFSRIQFTPDLLPSDIVGLTSYQREVGFYTIKGPIFANLVLADEINRAPPKVQSALLEAMQERQVTIGKETFPLPRPFFVLATQNPIEQGGTYPLPEAQVDRFLFKITLTYPSIEEEQRILSVNIDTRRFSDFELNRVISPEEILRMQEDAKKVYLDPKLEKYVVNIVDATRNHQRFKIKLGRYIGYGSSPRGSIGLVRGAKAECLMNARTYVTPHEIKKVAKDVLRHRILINYEGQAEGITSDDVLKEILDKVPVP
ncbi:MoxR family ATPase [Candidatus Woesearchaeota archaeon]|nr:MoxR family ATPase [Candidatus Woesearchaeota archaeon]